MLPPMRLMALLGLAFFTTLVLLVRPTLAQTPQADVHGSFTNEAAYRTSSPRNWTKLRSTLNISSDLTLNPSLSFRIGGRFWYDAVYDLTDQYSQRARDDLRLEADLREAFADIAHGNWHLRIGKQQVVWGEAVGGLFVADVVTPKDLREFILPDPADIRIPIWALDVQYYLSNMDFELVYIPFPDFNELPPEGSEFAVPSPLPEGLSGTVQGPAEPARTLENSSFGMRASCFVHGWDISLLYLYDFYHFPTPYRVLVPAPGKNALPALTVAPRYDRINTFGLTFSKEVRDIVFKGEATYRTSIPIATDNLDDPDGIVKSDVIDYLLSADATFFRKVDCNVQWLQRIILDHDPGMTQKERQSYLSVWLKTGFHDNRIEPEFFAISSVRETDYMIRPKVNFRLNDRWTAAVGMDIFGGVEDGQFGVYRDKDRSYVELTCAF